MNISDDGVSEIWLLNDVVTYRFRVVAAVCIRSSPQHNGRQDEKKKRGIHLQEESNYEYLSTKDIIIFFITCLG